MINYLVNKIGAIVKLSVNMYYDQKLVHNVSIFKKEISAVYDWSATMQSKVTKYIKKSLKEFYIKERDIVLDLGLGKGRILLYLNSFYKQRKIKLFGAEISEEVFLISQNLLQNTNVSLFNINSLEKNFIIKNINKIIMFNPFNVIVFQRYIEYILENIKYGFEFIYININFKQFEFLKNSQIRYIKYDLNYPILLINNKNNIIGYIN